MARATRARPLFSCTVLFPFSQTTTSRRTSDRCMLGRKHDFGPEKSSLILRSTAALRNPSHRAISSLVFVVHHLNISHLSLACAIPTQGSASSRIAKIVRFLLNTIVFRVSFTEPTGSLDAIISIGAVARNASIINF